MPRKADNEGGLYRREGQNNSGDDDSSHVTDGFQLPDLGAELDAPPAYGDHFDELQLSQAGFEAGAAVTGMLVGALPCMFTV